MQLVLTLTPDRPSTPSALPCSTPRNASPRLVATWPWRRGDDLYLARLYMHLGWALHHECAPASDFNRLSIGHWDRARKMGHLPSPHAGTCIACGLAEQERQLRGVTQVRKIARHLRQPVLFQIGQPPCRTGRHQERREAHGNSCNRCPCSPPRSQGSSNCRGRGHSVSLWVPHAPPTNPAPEQPRSDQGASGWIRGRRDTPRPATKDLARRLVEHPLRPEALEPALGAELLRKLQTQRDLPAQVEGATGDC